MVFISTWKMDTKMLKHLTRPQNVCKVIPNASTSLDQSQLKAVPEPFGEQVLVLSAIERLQSDFLHKESEAP